MDSEMNQVAKVPTVFATTLEASAEQVSIVFNFVPPQNVESPKQKENVPAKGSSIDERLTIIENLLKSFRGRGRRNGRKRRENNIVRSGRGGQGWRGGYVGRGGNRGRGGHRGRGGSRVRGGEFVVVKFPSLMNNCQVSFRQY
ncbi:nucleolin-like [Chrysoperla carnea]|uniref:nucleolin-like n=1 Tax=Chrysoperla carnea TaxID=189513 RepID=UPI001D078C6D|nr:nucleolin-like [Chrysoperla carnea]